MLQILSSVERLNLWKILNKFTEVAENITVRHIHANYKMWLHFPAKLTGLLPVLFLLVTTVSSIGALDQANSSNKSPLLAVLGGDGGITYCNCEWTWECYEFFCFGLTGSTTYEYPDITCPTQEDCPTYEPCYPCAAPDPPEECATCPLPTSNPKFSKAIYQSSLPSWPIAGTTVHLGVNATTDDGAPVRYQLINAFEFLTLSSTNDIIFTSNLSDGAYVGPNNVMLIEIVASVIGDDSRASSSVIALVFPRSSNEGESRNK